MFDNFKNNNNTDIAIIKKNRTLFDFIFVLPYSFVLLWKYTVCGQDGRGNFVASVFRVVKFLILSWFSVRNSV